MPFTALSVGIPVFNGGSSLSVSLDSLLTALSNLSGESVEILIMDNASTDNTRDIAVNYSEREPRIKYFANKQNLGYDRNVDCVITNANGEYVWLLGCGEAVKPDALKLILDKINKFKADHFVLEFDILREATAGQYEADVKERSFTMDVVFKTSEDFLTKIGYGVTPLSANVIKRAAYLKVMTAPLVFLNWVHVERIFQMLVAKDYAGCSYLAQPCFTLYRERNGWWMRSGNMFVISIKLRQLYASLERRGISKSTVKQLLAESYPSLFRALVFAKMNGLKLSRQIIVDAVSACGGYVSFWFLLLPMLLLPRLVYDNFVVIFFYSIVRNIRRQFAKIRTV